MQVTLIALGSGAEETLTAQARAALRAAVCILGAPRLARRSFWARQSLIHG